MALITRVAKPGHFNSAKLSSIYLEIQKDDSKAWFNLTNEQRQQCIDVSQRVLDRLVEEGILE